LAESREESCVKWQNPGRGRHSQTRTSWQKSRDRSRGFFAYLL